MSNALNKHETWLRQLMQLYWESNCLGIKHRLPQGPAFHCRALCWCLTSLAAVSDSSAQG